MSQANSSPANSERPRRYLITGAKGFIGAWIARILLESGNPPGVFDVDPDSQRLSAILEESQLREINFVQGDVTKHADLDRAVAANGITHILHLAGLQVPGCAADPLRGAMVNIIGTLNVFEVARRRRDQVQRVVYASSAAVFGPEEFYGGETVPEGAPLLPRTHYGVFKQCNEGNARVYYQNDGISSVGIRPWAVYGVGRDIGISSGPTKAIKAAVLRRPYVIGLSGPIDLQYVRDTARIFIRSAERDLPGARVYTPRGSVVHVEEFIQTLEKLLPEARGLIKARGNKLPIAADLDDSALRRDLGEDLHTPLEEGIKETANIFARLEREGRLETRDIET
jgi:nucleoside-diphosphate-sugar epimerase